MEPSDSIVVLSWHGHGMLSTPLCLSIQSHHLFTFETVSAIHSFILAMLLNPETQKMAQQELDSVVGMLYPSLAARLY